VARVIRLLARARVATAGDVGDPPCGAGIEGRQGGQGRKRPATRAIRLPARVIHLAATHGGGEGVYPGTSMVEPAAMAVDGGNANGGAHVAHAVAGDGPNVIWSTGPEMYVRLSLAARSTRTLARPRSSMGSRSLLTRVRTTFASATALARTLGVSTSQFPVSHHSDEGSGMPAWPMV